MIPVVITGRGLITPIGLSLAENLESLKTGKSGISTGSSVPRLTGNRSAS